MPLTLALRGGNATVPPLQLDGRGAVIGRSPEADWRLPDPRSLVSSRHCEIAHRDGVYALVDTSTNGTFVNGRRLAGPHRLADGDTIGIGDFEIAVRLGAAVPGALPPQPPAPPRSGQPVPGRTAIAPNQASPPDGAFAAFLHGAGIDRAQVRVDEATAMAAAGVALRRAIGALRAMDEDRVRARGEIGALPAPASGAAANPVVGARSLDQALALLLAPPQPGVVPGSQAIDDVALAVERHRVAVLQAMQAALAGTVDRLSPAAIRGRAGSGGDAPLWRAYEKDFNALDGGFVEMFAEAFRRVYDEMAAPPKG